MEEKSERKIVCCHKRIHTFHENWIKTQFRSGVGPGGKLFTRKIDLPKSFPFDSSEARERERHEHLKESWQLVTMNSFVRSIKLIAQRVQNLSENISSAFMNVTQAEGREMKSFRNRLSTCRVLAQNCLNSLSSYSRYRILCFRGKSFKPKFGDCQFTRHGIKK